jgi:hypothetical protein
MKFSEIKATKHQFDELSKCYSRGIPEDAPDGHEYTGGVVYVDDISGDMLYLTNDLGVADGRSAPNSFLGDYRLELIRKKARYRWVADGEQPRTIKPGEWTPFYSAYSKAAECMIQMLDESDCRSVHDSIFCFRREEYFD